MSQFQFKSRFDQFLRRLFPEHYSETAKCTLCKQRGHKSRMVNDGTYGWFCNEEECAEYNFWAGMRSP